MALKLNRYDMAHDTIAPIKLASTKYDYSWTSWGDLLPSPGTETWGRYEGDFYAGTSCRSIHKLGKGTVTYIGVLIRKPAIWKEQVLITAEGSMPPFRVIITGCIP